MMGGGEKLFNLRQRLMRAPAGFGSGLWTRRENRFATDSPLEGDGFELPVPRAMQARLEAKIAGFGCMSPSIICGCRRWPSAKAQSEISEPNLIARGTGSSNPSPSSEESANHQFLSGGAHHCGRLNAAAW
jgi:hypothetical protein